MFTVGLTGGIASGKTAVSDLFAARGIPVVDADVAARRVVDPGTEGLAELVSTFGREVVDAHGELDRRHLRELVFRDPAARRRLEGILHPRIREWLATELSRAQGPYALLVVPLLVGSDLIKLLDRVLVVDVPVAVQLERVVARDRCSEEQARSIVASQAPREERLAAADDVILNDGGLRELEPKVEALHQRYLALAGKRAAVD
jgi:dephospho-CoA kinase